MKTLPKLWLALLALLVLSLRSIAQSPGELVGYTQYDYQCNMSTGHRIAVDSLGGVHVAWMWTMSYPSPRYIVYAHRNPDGNWNQFLLESGGYVQLGVDSQNQPGVAFHNYMYELSYWTPLFRDTIPGSGMWPSVAIDRSDRVHCIFGGGDLDIYLNYTRSNNGGRDWTAPVHVDTLEYPSYTITASRVSGKVAIVYLHRTDSLAFFDIYYLQSLDGQTWDWQIGKVNITEYDPSIIAEGFDCDAVYDYNDNLHIVWNYQHIWYTGGRERAYIYHYDISTGTTSEVVSCDPILPVSGCDLGNWNNILTKMSVGVSVDNFLAVSYTRFDSADCSAGGYANGEIYAQYSVDNGANWSFPTNLTNSHTPRCAAGNCDSDTWPSMAEKIDNYLHIFYVDDKDAGGVPHTEGAVTDNPMRYLRVPVASLGIEDNIPIPGGFSLSQNYPNPFNARTTISFELNEESLIELAVYDITGALVETLTEGKLPAGSHAVAWDASGRASGVYYARLTTADESAAKKLVLLK